jgi:hypothetical protein
MKEVDEEPVPVLIGEGRNFPDFRGARLFRV